ncbi:hypothetical protein FDP08_13705 [Marinobacter panjinensis]|uniref:Lipoprotein n=1 Tax=Marinobacter panjinensis TaxID=2576384 RepID=A0A4U6R7R3_9GAMM|nr:hypothetical protein [Marinobacter panjinensis]TKV69068.1 hypothetical protein FDP08_13705 [Marinobacter panjinensis]
MKLFLKTACLVVVTVTLTGCFNGSSSDRSPRPDPSVDFTAFVKTQIENTDNTREAVQINKQEFSFNDQNNEQAFDDLFMQ